MHETLVERLKQIMERELGVVASGTQDLFDTGALDSLSFVNLLVRIEEEFGLFIALDEIDFDEFRTLESIAAFVGRRLDGRVVRIAAEAG
jgi:acyl carrier protein